MTDREKVYELSDMICKGCKARHDCDTENCIMSEVVAEYLLNNGYDKISKVAKEILTDLLTLVNNNDDFGRGVLGWNTEDVKMLIKLHIKRKYGVELDE